MNCSIATPPQESIKIGLPMRSDPRAMMAARLPSWLQPALTWITARPAPGEQPSAASPLSYVRNAFLLVIGGILLSAPAAYYLLQGYLSALPVLLAGLLLTTSSLGLFQVVVFHHCAHGTVLRSRERNRTLGRLVSAILLFKHFDRYQAEHMLHHNANKLFTDDDEFTDFVVGICELAPSMSRAALWRRLLVSLVSPRFHARFMVKRLLGSLNSHESSHNAIGFAVLASLLGLGLVTHTLGIILIAWVLPLTVLLQMATVFRILCEHRMPAPDVIANRGKVFVCLATAGVFPGVAPPATAATSLAGLAAWTGWWANMLTVQLLVRLFVLVGDAPCHDFHHRRPASKRWPDYIHARQDDFDNGCPGFPLNYIESWGLFRAIDQNFAAMTRAEAVEFADKRDDFIAPEPVRSRSARMPVAA